MKKVSKMQRRKKWEHMWRDKERKSKQGSIPHLCICVCTKGS